MLSDKYKEIKNPTIGLYKEKGSRFISYLFPVYSEKEVKERLEEVPHTSNCFKCKSALS